MADKPKNLNKEIEDILDNKKLFDGIVMELILKNIKIYRVIVIM